MENQLTGAQTASTLISYPEIGTYLKYCSDDPKAINGIFKDNKIRFTQPWALNDPLEFNPSIRSNPNHNIHLYYEFDGHVLPSEELFFRVQIVESQINNYGILSLTKALDSFDMWSRYANGHKGFLIELKTDFNEYPCMKSKSGEKNPLEEVVYVEDYFINLDELSGKYNGEIPFQELRRAYFFKKTSRWAHEKEYRLVRPLKDCPDYKPSQRNTSFRLDDKEVYLFNFSLDCISSITFGASMSIANKQSIEAYCSNHNIQFYQATIMKNQKDMAGLPGRVAICPIEDFGPRSSFHQMEAHHFCGDTSDSVQTPRKINKLDELPYYQDNKQLVDEMFLNLYLRKEAG